tara:strand:+ start:1102 stop:1902 length:801 start_codon:yes stop_codon:yes gene_type:complete
MSLIIHKQITEKLDSFIESKKIPNIIFHGTNGVGKKKILFDFLEKIYEDEKEYMNKYVMIVNCAHGKGIKFIREELKFFAKTNIHLQDGKIFKSIILLNADKLTIDAQSALRRCIELFSKSTRFFIIVDDKYKLLKPILSRFCEIFIPEPIIDEKITNLYEYHLENVYSVKKSMKVKKTKFKSDLEKLKKKNIFEIAETLYEKGYSGLDLINYINESDINEEKKNEYLIFIQKIKKEFRNEKILIACILNFLLIRSDFDLENISFM